MIRTALNLDSIAICLVNRHDIAIYLHGKQEYLCTWHDGHWKILHILHDYEDDSISVSCCVDIAIVDTTKCNTYDWIWCAVRSFIYDITRYFHEHPQRNMRSKLTSLFQQQITQLVNEYNTHKPSTTTQAD